MVHAFGAEFPDGIQDVKLPWVRRPLVLVRGKPVSVEQAVQVITGEEPLFEEVYEWEGMLWSSIFVTLVAKKYQFSVMMLSVP
ncbi:hypothetical protein AALA98_17875, partial [Lachnospiraceae bacterium 45-W7]